MRRHRSMVIAGLLTASIQAAAFLTGIAAATASDCPCKRIGPNSCIPDLACEERERALVRHFDHAFSRPNQPAPEILQGNTRTDFRASRPNPTVDSVPVPPHTTVPVPQSAPAENNAHAAPPAREQSSPAPASSEASRPGPVGAVLRILETGYNHLSNLGNEARGYGLYSYAIVPANSERGARFLSEVFKEIPSIEGTAAQPRQVNILYVPLLGGKENDFAALLRSSGGNATKVGADYARSLYDYRMARALLDHICNPPDISVRDLCSGDLSRGPYIFTYIAPASSLNSVPPPFLFVDLSNVHEQAFGELLSAFKEQVKRDDITDQAKIRTLRLTILSLTLTAADWVNPVQKALADIVHSSAGDDGKK